MRWDGSIQQRGGTFSPDHRLLASASGGSAVRLWEADTGRLRCTLVPLAHQESLTVATDGHYRGPKGIEARLVYVVQTDRGQEMLSLEEFAKQYGWKNDPERVRQPGK